MKRMKRVISQFLINHFLSGTHFFNLKRTLLNWCDLKCGIGSKIVGPVYFGNIIKITIGDNVWIGRNCTFNGNGVIKIEDNVDIAPEVTFLTGSHIISNNSNHRAGDGVSYTISVEKGVWIGARVTILGNTTIGNGSVVGACSLVNKSIASNKVYGGIPAKIISDLNGE